MFCICKETEEIQRVSSEKNLSDKEQRNLYVGKSDSKIENKNLSKITVICKKHIIENKNIAKKILIKCQRKYSKCVKKDCLFWFTNFNLFFPLKDHVNV